MKKRIFTFLATMIGYALYSQQGLAADVISQCKLGIPIYTHPLVHGDKDNLPIIINADYVEGDYPNSAIFIGNVDINHGNSRLQADEMRLYQKQLESATDPLLTVDVLGNVRYENNQVILQGQKGWSNLNTKDINVWQGDYQMVGNQGRGKAELIKQRVENRYTILKNGSFTSCLPGSNTWSVVGSKIIHDREKQVAKIWNARFKLGQVPVFYTPYLQLPVGDQRHSGFLTPNAKYSTSNYFEFYLPYYWNITPNIDATITPRYIHRRGNMWEKELRYLTNAGTGLITFNYLPADKVHEDKHRWLLCWQHSGVLDQVWRFNIDYTKVSDPTYFNDFDSKYGSNTEYATQIFSAGYSVQNFNATVSTKQFQIFNQESNNSYTAEPQLDVNWYHNDLEKLDLRIYGQAVHFVNTNSDMPQSIRLHLEPTINLPLSNDWGNVNTEAKLLATYYQQQNLDKYNRKYGVNLAGSVERVLPQFKIDGKMVLERNINWADGYTQTLEPHMQYLYVPYRDQSKVKNYDSSFLPSSDYISLFRERIYSGLDRISSANQVTTGVTTRVYDTAKVERFNVSVGRIYYFTDSHTSKNINWEQANNKIGSLSLAGDTSWHITDRWELRGGLQCDTRLNNVATGSGVIEYRRDENSLVQLNYHYASQKYILTKLSHYANSDHHKECISQVGAIASWPITDCWSSVGAYYFNTHENKLADQLLGLQYSSCCYAVRLSYERKLNGWDTINTRSKYDNILSFNVELRGLNSNSSLSTQLLYSNIMPYRSFVR